LCFNSSYFCQSSRSIRSSYPMSILVVGDVHGCLHTFQSILEQHWQDDEILIQLGDLIDRGNFSGEVVQFVQSLKTRYPERVFVLKGNHELELIEYEEIGLNQRWLRQRGHKTLESFLSIGLSLKETSAWMKDLPLVWENESILVSHAGISKSSTDPFNPHDLDGVLWTRQPLKNIGKVQIFGHTPTSSNNPEYDAISNSWNIDTGACFLGKLSAIKLSTDGKVIKTYSIPTLKQDIY
jgi:serine/threonine protein phosphatase 1